MSTKTKRKTTRIQDLKKQRKQALFSRGVLGQRGQRGEMERAGKSAGRKDEWEVVCVMR